MRRLMTAMTVVLALPLAAAAQQGQGQGQMEREHGEMGERHGQMERMHQGMQGPSMMGGDMMGMMMSRPGPGMLLRLRSTLELTDDQAAELESMHAEAREAMRMHQQAARQARMRAHQSMMGESADLDAFQAALEEAAQHNVQAMVAMARVHANALDVLTAAQRETMHKVMQAMHEMRGGMDGMHGEGMMGEGMEHEGMEHEGMEHEGMHGGG